MRRRASHLGPERGRAANALVSLVEAVAAGDRRQLEARLADDLVVRANGFVPGGIWRWDGAAAAQLLEGWLSSPPVALRSARVDVDRFFAAPTEVGFDGDLSWLAPGDHVAEADLVVRRVAVFATFDESAEPLLRAVEVYGDVHQTVAVSDRQPR
jgi:hypothetical protein